MVGKQCSVCEETNVMPVDALQSAVLRLYGPRAGGQISQNLLTSYSFQDLYRFLTGAATTNAEEPPLIEGDLRMADWVVVSMLKPKASQPETLAFKRLLSERPDLLRNKKVVVFAFNSPYYLDATDISKLSAYYAMYSKTPPFIEVAARILFQDLFAADSGALPISVLGVGYDLEQATSPDPAQVIPLFIDSPITSEEIPSSTVEPTPVPVFRVGDVIPLRTGVIYDRNGNPVPDGTSVRFLYSVISESSGSTLTQTDTETVDGIARAVYRIDRPGLLEIHASSEQNALSNLLRLDITTGVSAGVTLVAPTPQPTETMVPTPTVTATLRPTPTATQVPPPPTVHVRDWFLALLVALSGALFVSYLGIRMAIARWGLRWALCGLIGGLLFYNYIALGLPGSDSLLREAGTPGVVFLTMIGVVFGWGIGLFWRQISQQGGRPASTRSQGDRPATGPRSQSG
jgi:beta-N-acetylhexosaminidase